MRKIKIHGGELTHSEEYLNSLLESSEAVIDMFMNLNEAGMKRYNKTGNDWLLSAVYGYFYALGNYGFLSTKEDGITPSGIKKRYREAEKFGSDKRARRIAKFMVNDVLAVHEDELINIYVGIGEGMERLLELGNTNPVQRELAAYLAVPCFVMACVTADPEKPIQEIAEIARSSILAIGRVPNQNTTIKLFREIDANGFGDIFRQLSEHITRERGYDDIP